MTSGAPEDATAHTWPHTTVSLSSSSTGAGEETADDPPAAEGARYEAGAEAGHGGHGVVLQARDAALDRTVALKRLRSRHTARSGRFFHEARATARLEHPGVVPVHDVGTDDAGRPFYVMRYVRGETTLRDVIDRLTAGDPEAHRRYTFERRVRIVQHLAQTLAYAHDAGLVHRDVKPENVMLGPFGEVYLVDWGLAQSPSQPGDGPGEDAAPGGASLTGTPGYVAPEQVRGQVAPSADLFSLAAVLYELLSLRHYLGPDDAEGTLAHLLQRVLHEEPVPAEHHYDPVNGRVPRALSLVCARGLAKDPAQRHASAADLERGLQAWLEGQGPVVCPTTLLIRGLNRWRRLLDDHPGSATLVSYLTLGLGLLGAVALGVGLVAAATG